MTGPAGTVVSQVNGNRFSLISAKAIAHTHARYFHGEIRSLGKETILEGQFRPRRAVQIGEYLLGSFFLLAVVLGWVRFRDLKSALLAFLVGASIAAIRQVHITRSRPFEDDVMSFIADVMAQRTKT
jgi:hypothetical protein